MKKCLINISFWIIKSSWMISYVKMEFVCCVFETVSISRDWCDELRDSLRGACLDRISSPKSILSSINKTYGLITVTLDDRSDSKSWILPLRRLHCVQLWCKLQSCFFVRFVSRLSKQPFLTPLWSFRHLFSIQIFPKSGPPSVSL
jgi:hypothetical protein